jgi:hypothetical protein
LDLGAAGVQKLHEKLDPTEAHRISAESLAESINALQVDSELKVVMHG